MAYARGPDVSSHQGVIDWGKVAAGWEFAVARMTIGRSTLDDRGVANLKEMGATGIIPGAYGVVGYAEPVEDGAELLVRQIRAAGADPSSVLVMLDAEDFQRRPDGTVPHPTIDQVDRYAQRLRALIGRWPVAYVPLWWLGKHAYTVDGLGLSNCPWAQSHYYGPWYWSDTELFFRQPDLTHGWKRLAWLQYTDAATVAGIAGGVDANVFYGTAAELRTQLLGQHEETFMTLSTDEEQEILRAARQINATAGPGTTNFEQTVEATLRTSQSLINLIKGASGTLAGSIDSVRSAVLGAIAALPPPNVDVDEAAVAAQITQALQAAGVTVDPAAIAAAVRHDLAGALAA